MPSAEKLLAALTGLSPGDADGLDDGPVFPRGDAAVLVLVVVDADDAGVVLTRRSPHLATDGGFVAFPGGRIDAGESAEDAAQRECAEETGIDVGGLTVRGRLDATWNGAGFRILPVVATIEASRAAVEDELRPHDAEVVEARVTPLAWLTDPARHRVRMTAVDGLEFADDLIDLDDWRLVGPSASIAVDLAARLRGEGPDLERRARRRAELAHYGARRWAAGRSTRVVDGRDDEPDGSTTIG